MLARVPDSMWSMRCEIGCPIVTLVPGSVENCRAARQQRLARRPVSRRPTSISAASTPCTCSSYSARPVRRAVATTSGCDSRICSTRRPISSDLASDVPGSVLACTVRLPSVEFRQERRAGAGQGRARHHEQRQRARDDEAWMIEPAGQVAA
jgi:hypothetical protein